MRRPLQTYIVSTGNYLRRCRHRTAEQAVLYCFRSWPPAAPGILTRVWMKPGIYAYFDTAYWLGKAGYKVADHNLVYR